MTKETYYAVRIGKPPHHRPYFKLMNGTRIPAIFVTKAEAEIFRANQPATKVVRVVLHDGRCTPNAGVERRARSTFAPTTGSPSEKGEA